MKSLLLTLAALSAFPLLADDANSDALHLETIINAEAIKRVAAKYPKNAAHSRKEGWVRLSYIIGEDGTVADAIVEDSSGIKDFEKSALYAVSQWEFSPATENGKPITQCRNNVQFDFMMDKKQKGASRSFIRKYKQIAVLIDEDKLDEAQPLMAALKDSPKWNMYEDIWFWYLQASYYKKSAQPKKQFASLIRIIGNGEKYLPNDYYLLVLRDVFVLNIKYNRLTYALETFERLQKVDEGGQFVAELQPYKDKVEALLHSDLTIAVAAEIEERDFWRHRLDRNHFSFADIEGRLGQFDVRCENKRSTFKVSTVHSWHIPPSWGQCTLFVLGEPGSSFTLLQSSQQNSGS